MSVLIETSFDNYIESAVDVLELNSVEIGFCGKQDGCTNFNASTFVFNNLSCDLVLRVERLPGKLT